MRALRTAAWAADIAIFKLRGDRVTRALAILFALENGLDFDRGGDVSRTLATLYRGMRGQIVDASIGQDPAPFRAVAADLSESPAPGPASAGIERSVHQPSGSIASHPVAPLVMSQFHIVAIGGTLRRHRAQAMRWRPRWRMPRQRAHASRY